MKTQLPARDQQGHKGTFGTVLVMAGTDSDKQFMAGGAVLACEATLRSGAGLVKLLAEERVLAVVEQALPQVVGLKLAEDVSLPDMTEFEACVAGPAWLDSQQHKLMLSKALISSVPMVIDAGAINILAKEANLIQKIHPACVITPHPKEASRLAAKLSLAVDPLVRDLQPEAAQELAETLGCTVVLKNDQTVIADNEHIETLQAGNAALATGGSGDVLAGLVAGFMAQWQPDQLTIFECAYWGVKIHGLVADRWAEDHGTAGLVQQELLALLPQIIDQHRTN